MKKPTGLVIIGLGAILVVSLLGNAIQYKTMQHTEQKTEKEADAAAMYRPSWQPTFMEEDVLIYISAHQFCDFADNRGSVAMFGTTAYGKFITDWSDSLHKKDRRIKIVGNSFAMNYLDQLQMSLTILPKVKEMAVAICGTKVETAINATQKRLLKESNDFLFEQDRTSK